MQQTTVLTGVEEKAKGDNARGPWVLRVFPTAGGTKFQTFDVDLGEKAISLIGKSAEIVYELEDSKDKKFQNNVIKSIREAAAGEVAKTVNGAGSVQQIGPGPQTASFGSDRPIRSHETNRSDALGHAVAFTRGGEVDAGDLFKLADAFVRYIETGSAVEEAPEDSVRF